MKTLIAYCSSHGCAEKSAKELKTYLGENVELFNLKKGAIVNLNNFDRIIIGGSIRAGQIQKKVKHFCSKNLQVLLEKEIGLFICCMEDGENAMRELKMAYPEELFEIAKATAYFGGEFNFQKMNFLEKLIVKKVAHVKANSSNLNHTTILAFSERMDRIFNPFLFLA